MNPYQGLKDWKLAKAAKHHGVLSFVVPQGNRNPYQGLKRLVIHKSPPTLLATMTTERLDRIEAILDGLAQSAQEHTRDVDTLSDRMGELAQSVSELKQSVSELKQSVSELKQDRDVVWQVFDRVADGMLQFQAQQAASREALDQFTETMLQFQAQAVADRAVMLEILQYLRNQYPGNGHSGGDELPEE